MRWFWIERFTEFVSGQKAVAIKNVSLGEEHLHGYYPSFPVMPGSLVMEGMAQTGGLLLGELSGYQARLVLAKITKLAFHFTPRPGDTLTYTTQLDAVRSGAHRRPPRRKTTSREEVHHGCDRGI